MTNADINPIAWIRTRDGCPDWAEDCLYFQKPSELDLSCYQDEGKLDSTAIYSQETVDALQKENEELRGQIGLLRDAHTAIWLYEKNLKTAKGISNRALQATAPKDE